MYWYLRYRFTLRYVGRQIKSLVWKPPAGELLTKAVIIAVPSAQHLAVPESQRHRQQGEETQLSKACLSCC